MAIAATATGGEVESGRAERLSAGPDNRVDEIARLLSPRSLDAHCQFRRRRPHLSLIEFG